MADYDYYSRPSLAIINIPHAESESAPALSGRQRYYPVSHPPPRKYSTMTKRHTVRLIIFLATTFFFTTLLSNLSLKYGQINEPGCDNTPIELPSSQIMLNPCSIGGLSYTHLKHPFFTPAILFMGSRINNLHTSEAFWLSFIYWIIISATASFLILKLFFTRL